MKKALVLVRFRLGCEVQDPKLPVSSHAGRLAFAAGSHELTLEDQMVWISADGVTVGAPVSGVASLVLAPEATENFASSEPTPASTPTAKRSRK